MDNRHALRYLFESYEMNAAAAAASSASETVNEESSVANDGSIPAFYCVHQKCRKTYSTLPSLRAHIKSAHKISLPQLLAISPASPSTKKHVCCDAAHRIRASNSVPDDNATSAEQNSAGRSKNSSSSKLRAIHSDEDDDERENSNCGGNASNSVPSSAGIEPKSSNAAASETADQSANRTDVEETMRSVRIANGAEKWQLDITRKLPVIRGKKLVNGNSPVHNASGKHSGGTSTTAIKKLEIMQMPFDQLEIPDSESKVASKDYENALSKLNHGSVEPLDFCWLSKFNSQLEANETNFDVLNKYLDELDKKMKIVDSDSPKIWDYETDGRICSICLEGQLQPTNLIIKCVNCSVSVHQECYGITYLPENIWLCQKCLFAPNTDVKCILCPKSGGPMKKTIGGEWAHVNCALWIPECGFSRPIYLEPVDYIADIPESRYKMQCDVCNLKNTGACIQCYKSSCFTAFHVSCALEKGYNMKIQVESSTNADGTIIYSMKKEAFCSIHSNNIDPHNIFNNDYRLYKKRISDKIQQSEIFLSGNEIDGAKAKQIVNYWMMSKLVHNGYQKYPRVNKRSHNLQRKKRSAVAKDILSICKLIFEREKIKYQAFKTVLEITNEYWKKLDKIIKTIYEFIKFLDTESVFEYPVDLQLYPNYTQFVKHPIDLSIICSKIKSSDYKKFSAFKNDINTMYKNCLIYNPEGNYYNEYARKMQEITNVVFIRHEKQLTDFMVEIIQSLKRNFATNNLYSSERKRSKLLPISKIMEKENIKPEDIKIHKLYWVKAVGINWFPGIVIDLNTTEADYDGLFAKPQGRILDLNPNDENYNLIMYAHEKKKLQWVHKRSMYEMFSNKKIDDIFLSAKYLKSFKTPILKKAYDHAVKISEMIQKFNQKISLQNIP